MQIYHANIIHTPERQRFEVIPHGYVAVSDGRVEGVYRELPAHLADCPVTDWGDRLLIPAMNDMHVHAPQYRNQGIAMDEELLPWLQNYTFPEELKYADTAYAARMYRHFVHDLWRHGTMRAVAFASVHFESTRILMRLLDDAGMGGRVGKVNMNRNCPEGLQESVEEARAACDALVQEFEREDSRVRPIVTPRFIPSCTPDLLAACGEMARRYHLPVQSHLSENHDEIALVRALEPESRHYADAYDRYGLLGPSTVMAHCVWTDGDEFEMLRQRGVMVAHCPTSNFNVASGLAPVRRFLDAGIPVGLGSDVSAGHDFSIFRMMVYAIQVSKMHYERDHSCAFLTLSEAFWMATKCAGAFFGRVGSFEPGYDFDALVIDDSPLVIDDSYTLLQRLERFVYIGDDRHIAARYCQGRLIPDPLSIP
ncbi:MAG: amidohydrolase family protein [Bacteroidaceae bacterium]|nr:amidohydrolase family protein [Bacteroidaceae bacterium]